MTAPDRLAATGFAGGCPRHALDVGEMTVAEITFTSDQGVPRARR